MMFLRIKELTFLVIFIPTIAFACQNVQKQKNENNDLINHWYHFSEEDRGDTLVFVHDQKLKVVRGGRINFELFKDGTMAYEEAMSNDEPLKIKGKWVCESNTNTLTFRGENFTKNFLIISFKKNKLEVKQIN